MHDEFSGLEFMAYAWRERRIPAIACASAVAVALALGFLLPEKYTATATILIEPPAGNDPRAATAVSTVYLESLKTYEQLVSSDSVFTGAIQKLGLRARYRDSTIEELKKMLLSVSKPVNTSLIEVSATLPNPGEAQRLAQTIAEDAVALNSTLDREANDDLIREPDRLYRTAKERRERAESAQEQFLSGASVLTLDRRIASAEGLRGQVGLDLAREKTDLAAFEAQKASERPADSANRDWALLQTSATAARIRALEQQQANLTNQLAEDFPAVEKLKRQEEAIETELRSARTEEEAAMARIREIQSSTGVRRVRITLLDPGIVPQKPSFPNRPLIVGLALVLASVASLAFVLIRFTQRRLPVRYREPEYSRV